MFEVKVLFDFICLMEIEIDWFQIGWNITNVLQNEPETGEICEKCWLRVEQFHQFYVKIQRIQSTLAKNSIVVENFESNLKLDDDLSNDSKDFDLNQENEFSTATSWPGIIQITSGISVEIMMIQ